MNKIINAFPGYEFKDGKNMYRGTDLGKGGYVYAEPGMYGNVALLDVQSMHPNSAINMNVFGEYTGRFKELLDARIAIKHGDIETAKTMLGGRLAKYLHDGMDTTSLSNALKIAANSVYGLTSANFDNPFRDVRNKNNIVALRGALFLKTLHDAVVEQGYDVIACKTDSIKIPDATPDIIQFVMDFGKKYGYTFEHEETYERICLINAADFVAKIKGGKHDGEWTVTGAQFAVPYVFKKLFSKEEIAFEDMCETKSVTSALYLDMNEGLPDVSKHEKEKSDIWKRLLSSEKIPSFEVEHMEACLVELDDLISKGHNYRFIGKVGLFCPIKPGCGGGLLMREKDGKYYAATGSKGYRWLESEMVQELGKEADIDRSYYDRLVDEAVKSISKHGDFEWFVSGDPYIKEEGPKDDWPPWAIPCGDSKYATCFDCPNFYNDQFHMDCGLGYDISDVIVNKVNTKNRKENF